ncbi:hypothetical protein EUZ85_06430 [Hahella sp. KA22]|uniref:type VI secretion system contractile sheath domain-containing protein n=1 Tax=Hahella sp. KA22 TaxID=1628392 RepID=UPI000FDDF05C|nr:type VI secretion system contractile sheath large subunit [Hahella sp. KA22]AZZ90374.1 hypothetical protein ENC22_03880 [Hahella sp. KA22]QAY53744.1 hypothetical protein EUZ85_06430 [Hahella sp. KA22]
MSRTTISTGEIQFKTKNAGDKKATPPNQPCHIVVLGDFSGRGHRGVHEPETLAKRKVIEVDRDNFDDVFEQLKVELDIPVIDDVIRFRELDDMHPDYIYDRTALFEKFKSLKRRLKSNDSFQAAADEIRGWSGSASQAETPVAEAKPSGAGGSSDSGSLLESLLDSTSGVQRSSNAFDVRTLVQEIFAPYVSQGPDPRQQEMLEAVDQAASDLMRKIMHHSAFHGLEASWRGLYLLVRRLETDANLRIFIVDATRQELIADANSAESIDETGLYKLLVEKRSASGATPFSMILADYAFGPETEAVNFLSTLAGSAHVVGAAALTGGSAMLAGCGDLAATPDPDDWSDAVDAEFSEHWKTVREQVCAGSLALVAPRVLLRMPYGKRTSRTERFDFEELPERNRHAFYLWGNGAWLAVMLLAQHYTDFGWRFTPGKKQQVDRLPLHIYSEDGESVVTPCAEINITDSAVRAFSQAGLMAVRSIVGKDSVLIPNFRSISAVNPDLNGPWSE